jgi:alpha-N-arabinofuranosidase
MANIAQLVNVLQAMILTDGDKMITTPTYHVFELYRSHQGGRNLDCEFEADPIRFAVGDERRELPGLAGSASIKAGLLTLSVVNPHATRPLEAALDFGGATLTDATVSILTHTDLAAHNTFDSPATLRPQVASWIPTSRFTFAPASVTVLRARIA